MPSHSPNHAADEKKRQDKEAADVSLEARERQDAMRQHLLQQRAGKSVAVNYVVSEDDDDENSLVAAYNKAFSPFKPPHAKPTKNPDDAMGGNVLCFESIKEAQDFFQAQAAALKAFVCLQLGKVLPDGHHFVSTGSGKLYQGDLKTIYAALKSDHDAAPMPALQQMMETLLVHCPILDPLEPPRQSRGR
jgi:hypothetical protein